MTQQNAQHLYTQGWDDYALLDAGNGKKLERWGKVITIRPEVQAYFKPVQTLAQWRSQAHWEFTETGSQVGEWFALQADAPREWQIHYQQWCFQLELTRFKHLGLFPEQRVNWDFIHTHLTAQGRFLNLFAYTGAASCIARQTGAETVHVDAVKPLITWANHNMHLSGLQDIKWVREDALKFAEREAKRSRLYDGIIMDPPAWGLGAKGEKWKLENKLPALLAGANSILARGGFLILNTYSPSIDLLTIKQLAHQYFSGSQCEVKELWMQTLAGKDLYYGNVLRVVKA